MPDPFITISVEPSGSVVAKGANDDLTATLLRHAGFRQIEDWYGRRHRLPTTTPAVERAAIATHAAEMLRAARYTVDLDPDLDTTLLATPTDPTGLHVIGGQVLKLTDRIRGAANASAAASAVDQLLDPTDGVLIRLQEALEATAEQITDLDDGAYQLADRFAVASEFMSAAASELTGAVDEIRDLDDSSPARGNSHQAKIASYYATAVTSAARATSPTVVKTSPALGAPPSGTTEPSAARPTTTPPAERKRSR